MKIVLFIVLCIAVITYCQEEAENEAIGAEKKEKRGISLNLGTGLEGYSYLGPSSRGYRGYSGYMPMADYGSYDGVNMGIGSQNFAGGYQTPYQNGYNSPYGTYPYGHRGYGLNSPTSYSYYRQYNTPVNTFPLGGIGTVGPTAGPYGSPNGYSGINGLGFNRFAGGAGVEGLYGNGYQTGYY